MSRAWRSALPSCLRDFFSTCWLPSVAWAGEVGGSLLIHLSRALALDAGARYRYTGEITYLPRANGQTPGRVTSEVGVAFFHLGLVMKLGGVRPPREEEPGDADDVDADDVKEGIR